MAQTFTKCQWSEKGWSPPHPPLPHPYGQPDCNTFAFFTTSLTPTGDVFKNKGSGNSPLPNKGSLCKGRIVQKHNPRIQPNAVRSYLSIFLLEVLHIFDIWVVMMREITIVMTEIILLGDQLILWGSVGLRTSNKQNYSDICIILKIRHLVYSSR